MSFRSIGVLADEVLREAGKRAAALDRAAQIQGIKDRGALKPRQVGAVEGMPHSPSGGSGIRLIVCNTGEPTQAAHEGVFPARRVGSPLVLVWDRDHASMPSG